MDGILNAFIVLFIVIDPIGVAWLFAAMTQQAERDWQRRMAIRGVMLASIILLVFFFIGDILLHWMGISLPAFKIAGGCLLFLLSIDMVFARHSGLRSTTTGERHEAEHKLDISVFPLAFPLIAGPGALTTVLLMAGSQSEALSIWATITILLLVLGLALAALLSARYITRLLGETGANVVSRVLGVILAALAVQYVIDGIRQSLL